MALVTTKEMFEKAFQGGYAIGAFNINNMEIVQGVVAAAKAQNSAVILQVSKSALKYAHPKYLKAMVDAAVEETGLDIALHLDHGPDLETCKECIECGFTSVMFDGSHYDYEENVHCRHIREVFLWCAMNRNFMTGWRPRYGIAWGPTRTGDAG